MIQQAINQLLTYGAVGADRIKSSAKVKTPAAPNPSPEPAKPQANYKRHKKKSTRYRRYIQNEFQQKKAFEKFKEHVKKGAKNG